MANDKSVFDEFIAVVRGLEESDAYLSPMIREQIREQLRETDRADAGLFFVQSLERELGLGPDEYVDLEKKEDGTLVAVVNRIEKEEDNEG